MASTTLTQAPEIIAVGDKQGVRRVNNDQVREPNADGQPMGAEHE